MQFDVTKEIRVTGVEVDLFAKHRVSGEEIYVECKAHKSTLPADVITKIIGNVFVENTTRSPPPHCRIWRRGIKRIFHGPRPRS